MPLIYFLICLFLYILLFPLILLLGIKKKFRSSIFHRFFPFIFPSFCINIFKKDNIYRHVKYHFHACSLGEVSSLTPILNALIVELKLQKKHILISTITQTGHKKATELFNEKALVCYLPFEIFLPIFFYSFKNLKKLIVLEAELYLLLFASAKFYGAKTILLNARIRVEKYKKLGFLYKKIFSYIDIVLAQNKEEFNNLSYFTKRIQIFTNIKIFNTPAPYIHYQFAYKFILAASTHKGEEKIIIEAFINNKNTKLFIAPRHPERFEEVYLLSLNYKLITKKLTEISAEELKKGEFDVLTINKINELINFYARSPLVILGGSFIQKGGHNPLECAYFNCILISGKYIFNQKTLFNYIDNYYLIEASELGDYLLNSNKLLKSHMKKSNKDLTYLINILRGDNNEGISIISPKT